MSQPSDSSDLSMDNVFEGQPFVTRIPKATYNLLSMDYVFEGQPWVTWNPDSAKQKSKILYFMWGQ